MLSVVKGMDKAMDTMNLERVRCRPLLIRLALRDVDVRPLTDIPHYG